MLLAMLLVLRGDLLDRWQQQLPPESPNYFLINIAPEQVTPLKAFLSEHQVIPESFYPIVRARLTQINGQSTDGNPDEALNRELNLTRQTQRPDHNPITAGSWPPKAGEVSIEEGLAERLGLKLGDGVTFTGDTRCVQRENYQPAQGGLGKVCGQTSSLFSRPGRWMGSRKAGSPVSVGKTATAC